MPVTYVTKALCVICERRPEDMTVVIEGHVGGVCSTCWERMNDERPEREDPDAD